MACQRGGGTSQTKTRILAVMQPTALSSYRGSGPTNPTDYVALNPRHGDAWAEQHYGTARDTHTSVAVIANYVHGVSYGHVNAA